MRGGLEARDWGASKLLKIFQFGVIKVVPSAFNLLLIPYLVKVLGAGVYGTYSLLLGYALLVATVVGAIVTQPMYRFLSSRPEELELFNSFAFLAAGLGAVVTFCIVFLQSGNLSFGLGFAIFGWGAVIFGAASVRFQIENRIGRLALFEFLRVITFVLGLAVQLVIVPELVVRHVIFAISLSYIVPLFLLMQRPSLTAPDLDWLLRSASFGAKSAAWLLLAGIPIVGSKAILLDRIPDVEFGAFAALADISYRGFGIVNAAIVMWVFPAISRAYDENRFRQVRQLLTFSLATYGVFGLVALIISMVMAQHYPSVVGSFSNGLVAVGAILVSSFMWQGMSIVHKPFELTMRTSRMVVFMLVALTLFVTSSFGMMDFARLDAIISLCLSLMIASMFYSTSVRSVRIGS